MSKRNEVLEAIAGKIQIAQGTINVSVISIGGYLQVANKEIGNQKVFLAWAKKECGYGKTMAYKLISVYDHFKDDADMIQNLAVMSMLMGYEQKIKAGTATPTEVKAAAKIVNANAKGNRVQVNEIVLPVPTAKVPKAKLSAIVNTKNPEQELTDNIIGQSETSTNDIDLRLQLQTLQTELQEAQYEIEDLTDPKVAIIPTLSQFRSPHSHVALGLTEGQSRLVKNVKASANELTSIWTAQANKEAYDMIIKHRDTLVLSATQNPELKLASSK